jgi:hypothetical protein
MIRLRAIVGSALAAAIINILGALLIIAALAPESPRLSHQNSQSSPPLSAVASSRWCRLGSLRSSRDRAFTLGEFMLR